MLYFGLGVVTMVVILPILQSAASVIVTLLDYWSTAIAAKTVRINQKLEKEQAEIQLGLEERQMENAERPPAIGFHVMDEEALEMEAE